MARSYSRAYLTLVFEVLLLCANGAWQKGSSLVMSQSSSWHASVVALNNTQAAVCFTKGGNVVCNIVSLNGSTLTKGASLVLPNHGSSLHMAATVNTGRLLVASNAKGQLPECPMMALTSFCEAVTFITASGTQLAARDSFTLRGMSTVFATISVLPSGSSAVLCYVAGWGAWEGSTATWELANDSVYMLQADAD